MIYNMIYKMIYDMWWNCIKQVHFLRNSYRTTTDYLTVPLRIAIQSVIPASSDSHLVLVMPSVKVFK